MKNSTRTMVRILKYAGLVIGIVVVLYAGLLLFLTVTEFRPEPVEEVPILAPSEPVACINSEAPLRLVSWNIGYGCLGAKQDFFMDGGTMVRPGTQAEVEENLDGALSLLDSLNADIWMIQEIDAHSKRSYFINAQEMFADATQWGYAAAYNFKCLFVPFPLPPVGQVASGLASFSSYAMTRAERVALPVLFSWPVRVANLKRCLLVSRYPLSSGGELVLVNLHLEAFDDGEAKIAQTRELMNFLKAEYAQGNMVIAGGDFNQTFPHQDSDRYPLRDNSWAPGTLNVNMLPTGWKYVSDQEAPTCRSTARVYEPALQDDALRNSWQYYLIDGFIVSPNVQVQSMHTVDAHFRYSDHNPVLLEVMLRE